MPEISRAELIDEMAKILNTRHAENVRREAEQIVATADAQDGRYKELLARTNARDEAEHAASVEGIAEVWRAGQSSHGASGLYTRVFGGTPASPASTTVTPPTRPDPNAPRPGSVEAIAAAWKARQTANGASAFYRGVRD
jgi:hypothetical protein